MINFCMLSCARLGMKIYLSDFKALLIRFNWDGLSRSDIRSEINCKKSVLFWSTMAIIALNNIHCNTNEGL